MVAIVLYFLEGCIYERVLPLGWRGVCKDLAMGSFLGCGLTYDALIVLSHCQLLLIDE